jgi:hypothetical protein
LVNIDKILDPDEYVIKHQITDSPSGNLYLTNTRVIFLRFWRFLGNDNFIRLSDIQNVTKSMGYLKIKAEKEYSFMFTSLSINEWITAIKQAQQELIWNDQPGLTPRQTRTKTPPKSSSYHCPQCNRPVIYVPKYSRYYCNNCQKYVDK